MLGERVGTYTLLTEPGLAALFERLIERGKRLPPMLTAVAHPRDENSLRGAAAAKADSLIARLASCAMATLMVQARLERSCKAIGG